MEYIEDFSNIGAKDTLIAGGKGASLGEMTKAGVPVPQGFVVLSSAFERFLTETDIGVQIAAILDTVKTEEMYTVEHASEKIQGLILSAKFPESITEEIQEAFVKLDVEHVAVRSSATAEDSASAAWAGQLDSFLNTIQETLFQNIQKCWASLFTPRAIVYRFEKSLHTQKISVAVVVQTMVQSEVSGIAFSVHPVTQNRNQLIIEAGLGLGEAIVSGQVTPDSYVVTKEPLEILDKNIAIQERMLVRSKEGGNVWLATTEGKAQKLSDLQILELSKLIIQIENHYGFPCDIEWALEDGKFYITQSRPITTLSATETAGLLDSFLTEINDLELAPASSNSAVFVQASGWNKEDYFNLYYSDRTSFPLIVTMKGETGIMYWPITKAKHLSEEVFLEYWEKPAKLTDRTRAYQALEEKVFKQYAFLTYDRVNTEQSNKLAVEVATLLDDTWRLNAQGFFSIYFDKPFCLDLLHKCGASISTSRLDELWEKATTSTSDSFDRRRANYIIHLLQEGKSWETIAEQCQYFEANYNSISGLEATKRALQKKYGQFTSPEVAQEYFDKERLASLKVVHDYTEWFETLNVEEQRLVAYTQEIMKLRDIRKDAIGQMLAVVYRFAEKVFTELSLDKEYIFYSTFDELLQGAVYLRERLEELKSRPQGFSVLVTSNGQKRLEYNSFDEIKSGLDSRLLKQVTQKYKHVLSGQTGNPGKVMGRVRIINNVITESHLFQNGEILVTGMTRPEFVPLMHKAAAIITDEGGITSHAAIVARELKKPCIVGTKIATRVLHDGDLVEVDANNGIIQILKRFDAMPVLENAYAGSLSRDKYVYSWGAKGFSLLFLSLFHHALARLPFTNVLSLTKEGELKVYWSKEARKQATEYGTTVFTNLQKAEKHCQSIHDKALQCDRYASMDAISSKQVRQFLEDAEDFLIFYLTLDPEFTNDTSAILNDAELLEFLGQQKNQLREKINQLFFVENSVWLKCLRKIELTDSEHCNLESLTLEELIKLADGETTALNQDRISFLIYTEHGHVSYIFDKNIVQDIWATFGKWSHVQQVRGVSVAKKGVFHGRVKKYDMNYISIDKEIETYNRATGGFVFVADHTSPELFPLMQKSIAIIANMGGILSHAAITARELDLPCIVGTEFATHILQNDDLVEVDANNGIVTILETAKQ